MISSQSKFLSSLLLAAVACASFVSFSHQAVAQTEIDSNGPLVFDGEEPNDWRLRDLKNLKGYFPLAVPNSRAAWEKRADEVRQRILVSCGLWPMPPRGEINATIHGLVDRDEYTVEKVFFESQPGFYVTGSLYRPKLKTGPFPVVLSPYGHYANGRFHDHGRDELVRQIKTGAERFEVGGRHPLQARCVQLARMGCIVFHYDMIGYADSKQLSYELAHRHDEPRPEMENAERWGLYSAQAEMRLQSIYGLQTFNSLRAVDFVVGLPDVDKTRIGVTGSSGGGTQTMMLAALEPRITVSFPAVMVSTAMQGGCTCENATCLRLGTGNIEFAGLFAPRPQGIMYANDWTKEFPTKGLPELKKLYKLYDAEDLVQGDWVVGSNKLDMTYFQHNFNAVSRDKMYEWMNRHLALGIEESILEHDYDPLTIPEMSVWNEEHPAPPAGDEFETKFLRELSDHSDKKIASLAKSSSEFRKVVRPALKTLLATSYDDIGPVERENLEKLDAENYWQFKDKIKSDDTELPVLFLHPKDWNNEVVIWASGEGKSVMWNEAGKLRAEAKTLLDAGYSIVSPDLFQQGEFLDGGKRMSKTRKVENNRDYAGFTFGYNSTLIGHRVHDLLAVLKFVDNDDHGTERVHMLATDGAGPYAILTSVLAGKHIGKLAVDDGDFRFASLKSWRDPDFLPGAVKYGDLPAMIGLGRAEKIWIGTSDTDVAKAAMEPYRNLDGKPKFAKTENTVAEAVDWITN